MILRLLIAAALLLGAAARGSAADAILPDNVRASALSQGPCASGVQTDASGVVSCLPDALHDVRDYGATCDGTTDDVAAFNAAYADLSASGGGTLLVPGGKTCRISGDVLARSNVALRCEPGAVLKATDDASFTLAMVTGFIDFTNQDNVQVEGCTFDLNGFAKSGIFANGTNIVVRHNVFQGGATSNGSAWGMVSFNCFGSMCELESNRAVCANTAGANDTGFTVTAPTNGEFAKVAANQAMGCENNGILVTAGVAHVEGNRVTAIGTTGIGINLGNGTNGLARGNNVTVSGSSGIGIRLAGLGQSAVDNKVEASGASGVAIKTEGNSIAVTANHIRLTSDTAGTDDATGIHVTGGGIGTTITANTSTVSTTDAQTHVVVSGANTTITGNYMVNGAHCIAPSLTEFGFGINTTINGNRCWNAGTSHIIMLTGWSVVDNYLAWLNAGGKCVIELGDARDPGGMRVGTSHSMIAGNLIHSSQANKGICANEIPAQTCNGGSKIHQACTADTTVQCPGATCGDCCTPEHMEGVQIVGNHILLPTNLTGPAIDIGAGVSASSVDITNWIIDGNDFTLHSSATAIAFPTANQSKVTNIVIGSNAFVGGSYTANFTRSQGRDENDHVACFQIEGLAAGDDNYVFWIAPAPVTITGVGCNCVGSCATTSNFTLEDRSGNGMTISGTNPTCSTTGNATFAAVTANNALVEGEPLAFDVTNTPTSGGNYTLCVRYRKT